MKQRRWRRKIADLASSPWAAAWLFVVSFSESVAQPVPPDLMLAPMSAAQPRRWFYYATVCTVASVLGGLLGWLLGYFLFDAILPWLERIPGWVEAYPKVEKQLQTWGAIFVFVAGFSPLPYKVFTFTAGALAVPVWAFVVASFVGRGLRFYLVAWLMHRAGAMVDRSAAAEPPKPTLSK